MSLEQLVEVCHWMNQVGYSPATSGNYSLRDGSQHLWVSASGIDKGKITASDFIRMDLAGTTSDARKPSDESLIHARIYAIHSGAKCILHAHSVANTVVGLKTNGHEIDFLGFEMQKAFTGIMSHERELKLAIIENSQDMQELCEHIKDFGIPAFLIRGHGIYVWGESVAQAKRHLEGVEFLLQCKLELMR